MSSTITTPRRRSFLAGLAVLAAPVATVPVAAAETAPAITEAAELLALGDEIAELEKQLDAAAARLAEALVTYEESRPAYPPELQDRDNSRLSETVHDPFGNVVRFGEGDFRRAFRSHLVAAFIIERQISHRTKEGRMWRRIARVAKKFERDEAAALAASRLHERNGDVGEVSTQTSRIAEKVLAYQPAAMAGVVNFARAASLQFKAMNAVQSWRQPGMSEHAVEALLRVVQEGGAQ